MKNYIEKRAVEVANFMIHYNATVRETAKNFGISKSTVHTVVPIGVGCIGCLNSIIFNEKGQALLGLVLLVLAFYLYIEKPFHNGMAFISGNYFFCASSNSSFLEWICSLE